jgi:hypothetical protein
VLPISFTQDRVGPTASRSPTRPCC